MQRLVCRLIVAFGVLLAVSANATGQEPIAKITEYGRYKGTVKSLEPADGTSGGVIVVDNNDGVHVETTLKIPCKVGEMFGYRLQFSNLPKNRDYILRDVVEHPPIRQPDGKILTISVVEFNCKAGFDPSGLWSWNFLQGFEYELVPGKWTRKMYIDGKEVAGTTMTFEVK
jgi:hypothetical protein